MKYYHIMSVVNQEWLEIVNEKGYISKSYFKSIYLTNNGKWIDRKLTEKEKFPKLSNMYDTKEITKKEFLIKLINNI